MPRCRKSAPRPTWKRLPAGASLFHQGDKADRFYFLFSGQIKLHRVVCDGQEKLVEVMRAGESFAEALLFKGTPCYPVSATALKASPVASLNGPHYRRILEQQPDICPTSSPPSASVCTSA